MATKKKDKKRKITPVEQALLDEMGLPDRDRRSVLGVYENPYWYGNSTEWMRDMAGPRILYDFIVMETGSHILLETSDRLRKE